ncbi:oxygen-binding di-iron domain-containing protein [Thermofilum pendens]|uniref:Beta-lactamase domain protein n=1 Tax=Thermofilum pendens (strain DSM 2475 / Hrk 5) TaxID=368408 RepID=A1RYR1_THEPD|nr:MBL fold metallo-hydrolase [Thermofilum pendens]ABL78341.1 beta-lactamase domain protein [Thermofilum pendens Hrk 5]
MILLYTSENHRVAVFRELTPKGQVQTNQFIIVDGDEALLADTSGRAVFAKLLSQVSVLAPPTKVKYLFYTHQDPDVIGAAASWYTALPNAKIVLPELWVRFLPHVFPPDVNIENRVVPVGDSGAELQLGNCTLKLIPAHFLHSPGNFSLYDPCSKILYSGDVLASLLPPDKDYDFAPSFEEHVKYMEPFHKRYMASGKALKAWVSRVKALDVETIVPQHGAILKSKEVVQKALAWLENLEAGVDLLY